MRLSDGEREVLGPWEGTTLLQAGWEVRSGEGLRTSQQTSPSVGAGATGLATEMALAGSGGPSQVRCQCWSQRTDRQKQVLPSVGQRRRVPRGRRPEGRLPWDTLPALP